MGKGETDRPSGGETPRHLCGFDRAHCREIQFGPWLLLPLEKGKERKKDTANNLKTGQKEPYHVDD